MKTLLKYLGAILVLCGVVCLAVYAFYVPARVNAMLVVALATELVGIISFILINKFID